MTLSRKSFSTPLGVMHAFASAAGVRAILFEESDPGRNGVRGDVLDEPDHDMLCTCAIQLREYFAGERQVFALPLDPVGTAFQQDAWRALRGIPFGETRSYGEQAAAIGKPSAVRAIGAANGRNPLTIVVPCHRVIGSSGQLTGFASGLDNKRALLELEGVLPRAGELPFADG
ncbi:MAG: methylated-DNA--[protein]-cysteine S-methyltransferase [Planctomycetota bacterium]